MQSADGHRRQRSDPACICVIVEVAALRQIRFSKHAREMMVERGASENEVLEAIQVGEQVPAKHGRQGCRRNFQYERAWGARVYAIKQVLAIVAEESDGLVVVTVYTFYF